MRLACCDETQHRGRREGLKANTYYRRLAVRHLVGIHAVAAAVSAAGSGGPRLERVVVSKGTRNARVQEIVDQCRQNGVPIRFEPRSALDRLAGSPAHQNVVAVASTGPYSTLDSVIETVADPCTVIVLDSVQDPRNLGAIVRTADAAGAEATVIPERRAAGLTDGASKSAAGALESLKIVRVKNLGQALDRLKAAEFWVYGLDADADVDYDAVEYADRCALVMGGESRGLRAKIAERCDYLVRIPLVGSVPSLNVSVAAGVALFEVCRQRRVDGN